MPREVLLIEPNYRNKYPPMGLMKISTYYKQRGDNVRFYKGDLQKFTASLLCEELIRLLFGVSPEMKWQRLIPTLTAYIRCGKTSLIPTEIIRQHESTNADADMLIDLIRDYRIKFKSKDFFTNPRFDIVGITTLFTFEWAITIDTINYAKQLCKDQKNVLVGGIASSIIPQEITKETGIVPIEGILDRPGMLDADSDVIIDELPLDYSILNEIEYKYPTGDAYFAYMTRGCPNKCKFCAVPRVEIKYQNYIQLRQQLETAQERFGEQRNLMLLDNNVLASECYEQIIDEIIACGFGKGAKYIPPNPYEIAYRNLVEGINDRAYIRAMVEQYDVLLSKCSNRNICRDVAIRDEVYRRIMESECDQIHTATKEAIIDLHEFVSPLYKKYAYRPVARQRIVDFNQGIDGRKITPENVKKLAEINIHPVRIAFDNWKDHHIYERAVRAAAAAGLTDLSNYILYNYDDEPIDLYRRMKLSVDLCEELNVTIFSFPMKYHPIDDPDYFRNRNYIGRHWNRKFIRAIQAVLNATKGKIGRGKSFFEEAFGQDTEEFERILWMPEAFIIYRRKYDRELREKLAKKYSKSYGDESNLANEWWSKFLSLNEEQLSIAKEIIANNDFSDAICNTGNKSIDGVLKYYKVKRG